MQKNNNNSMYYNIYEEYGLKHYQLPKVFFTNKKYIKMSNDAKIAWSILKDRFQLSVKNEWYDENGNIYFVFSNANLMEILNVGKDKLISIKKELEKNNLLEQKRMGLGKANRLYIKKPIVTKEDVYEIKKDEQLEKNEENNSETSQKIEQIPCGSSEVGKTDFKKSEKPTSRSRKKRSLEVGKNDPNDIDFKDTEFSNTDLNPNLNQVKGYIWNMKLPMPLKKFFWDKVEVLVDNDTTFDIFEIEYFYNTYTDLIDPECTREDVLHLNDLEFTKVIKKMYKEVKRPINNMEGLIKTWVQWGIHYKIENKNDEIDLI